MTKIRTVLALLAALQIVSISLYAAESPSLDDIIPTIMKSYVSEDGPGCAVGVADKGQLVYNHGFGLADMEHAVPVSETTVFRIGSVTKQFVAASIALLAMRGELDLDAPVRGILPTLPESFSAITIRHLVAHSGGIPDVYKLLELLGHDPDGNFYPSELTLEIIYRMKELEFEPGTKYEYSNAGYLLLAQVVEAVSGKTMRQFAQDNIFGPLGMEHTHFHDNYREIVPNRAYGYGEAPTGGWEIRNSNFYVVGDGGVFTTVSDLARWDANFYSNTLGGGDAFLKLIQTPYEYIETGAELRGKPMGYAFALFITELNGVKMIFHPGGWAGFGAVIARFPEQQRSIIMLCNQKKRGFGETFDLLAASLTGTAGSETE